MKTLTKVRAGQRIKASTQNTIIGNLNEASKVSGNQSLGYRQGPSGTFILQPSSGANWWIGKIDSSGKIDYSDCRYYVRKEECSNSGPLSDCISFQNNNYPSDLVITATNLDEWTPTLSDSTHILSDNIPVVIFEFRDLSVPSEKRYVFHSSNQRFKGERTVLSHVQGTQDNDSWSISDQVCTGVEIPIVTDIEYNSTTHTISFRNRYIYASPSGNIVGVAKESDLVEITVSKPCPPS